MFFGAPLVTGGLTALVFALAMVAILVVRIGLEEALLVKELEGYEEYRRRVRWRLVPYLW
jgi:protein-S-isoprenylcysteine O-methyltransferase Ste14